MLVFTPRGHLTPNLNIRSSVEDLKLNFVDAFAAGVRHELFEKYTNYSQQLKDLLAQDEMLQWIDGSFVTKTNSPGDIDLVTFLSYEIVEQQEKELEIFRFPFSVNNFGVDAYIVKTYPNNHPKYPLYIGDRRIGWINLIKQNETGQEIVIPKGF
jgi:hypothetical protein